MITFKLFNENGSRNIAAEKQLENVERLTQEAEERAQELAQRVHLLDKAVYVPPRDEAAALYDEAQRMAAGMSAEIISTLRSIMLTSKRPTAQLDAAKALFEIAGRVKGGDGKAGSLPGANVLVIDGRDLQKELDKRKLEGAL
jgi:hypothetical protein